MFLAFYFQLRAHGLKVSPTEWLSLMEAVARGFDRASLQTFYGLARSLLVKREGHYDAFDRAWDLSALEQGRPQPRRIRIRLAEAKWGELELALAGTLEIDAEGRPDGRLTVKARNWRDILTLIRAGGWMPAGWVDLVEDALSLAAQLSGNPQSLDLPLDFSDGAMSLGPIPLGAAPVIRLR